MKRLKKISYIILIVIVVILSLTIYTNDSKDNGQNQKEKTFSEIKFVETKLVNLLNAMNNIQTRNYNVVTSELSKETMEKSDTDSSSSKSGSGGSSSGGGSGGQNSSDSGNQEEKNQDSQEKKKFELRSKGVLTNSEDINWEMIKSEIENLYISLPSITMDLYQLNVNQEDVLAFNTEYDNLTSSVKDEKKEEVLEQLVKVYDYIPKFLRGSGQEELYTILVETKYNIFKGYAKLDRQNFQEISKDIKNAIDSYSKLLTYTEIEAKKQYSISKVYVMINELQNAVNLQEPSVFLIKYKNLLEEINNI